MKSLIEKNINININYTSFNGEKIVLIYFYIFFRNKLTVIQIKFINLIISFFILLSYI